MVHTLSAHVGGIGRSQQGVGSSRVICDISDGGLSTFNTACSFNSVLLLDSHRVISISKMSSKLHLKCYCLYCQAVAYAQFS